MSTKIHGGLIATDADPFVVATRVREVVQPIYFERFARSLDYVEARATEAPGISWASALYLDEGGRWDVPISTLRFQRVAQLHELVGERQRSMTRTFGPREEYTEIGYDVTILPNGVDGQMPLVLLFSEDTAYRQALLESEVVEEFGYWDNTDRPDGVSKAQWRAREQAWSVLGHHAPSEVGLTIQHPGLYQTEVGLRGLASAAAKA